MRDFPDSFLWGSGTAAHQVEGNNTASDWWRWERAQGSGVREVSGRAIDHWNRFDEDFALLGSLGHNAHRFSLEWSRIEPEPGNFSTEALDHYAAVLDSIQRNGMTPFASLYHFSLPQWFQECGGWLAKDALDRFEAYAGVVAERLGDQMPFVCTVNEPQIMSIMGFVTGAFPPGLQDPAAAVAVNRTLIAAHRRATVAVRAGKGSPRVGVCLQLAPVEALRPGDPADEGKAAFLRAIIRDDHLADLAAGGDVGDWVGLQYYTRLRIDGRADQALADAPEGAEVSSLGWEVHPAGFDQALRDLAAVGLPIYVTENGISTQDDDQRISYMESHLRVLADVMADGVDVRGYLHWTSFDNFEWYHGYEPTFGLVGIDRDNDLARLVRPSARAYARLATSGRLTDLRKGQVDFAVDTVGAAQLVGGGQP